MTGLEVLLAVAGVAMTVLVVAGMILITPRGLVDVNGDATDPQGSDLSRADPPDPARVKAAAPGDTAMSSAAGPGLDRAHQRSIGTR